MRNWLLPESIEDALPKEARHIETMRRRMLDLFAVHGYEQVMPPLLEYVESLLTGTGHDLDLRTFKLVDQISGRTMGVRADITPQVARIDAHLLNRPGVTRLCYCGSVLHALPSSLLATREPLQIGAELYGYAGIEADVEVLRLMASALETAGVGAPRLDLGHVGIFRALAARAGLAAEAQDEILAALQAKDIPGLRELLAGMADPVRAGILALPELYGGREALAEARRVLPEDAQIAGALDALTRLADLAGDLKLGFDLADLRGYHYHNGVVFAAYADGHPSAVALGGRYDGVGGIFGRARPATGFSMDLRELARLAPATETRSPILAPAEGGAGLDGAIAELRARGEAVVRRFPGEAAVAEGSRELAEIDGKWILRQIAPRN